MQPDDILFIIALTKIGIEVAVIMLGGWGAYLGLSWLSRKSEMWHERRLRRMPERIQQLQPKRR